MILVHHGAVRNKFTFLLTMHSYAESWGQLLMLRLQKAFPDFPSPDLGIDKTALRVLSLNID